MDWASTSELHLRSLTATSELLCTARRTVDVFSPPPTHPPLTTRVGTSRFGTWYPEGRRWLRHAARNAGTDCRWRTRAWPRARTSYSAVIQGITPKPRYTYHTSWTWRTPTACWRKQTDRQTRMCRFSSDNLKPSLLTARYCSLHLLQTAVTSTPTVVPVLQKWRKLVWIKEFCYCCEGWTNSGFGCRKSTEVSRRSLDDC